MSPTPTSACKQLHSPTMHIPYVLNQTDWIKVEHRGSEPKGNYAVSVHQTLLSVHYMLHVAKDASNTSNKQEQHMTTPTCTKINHPKGEQKSPQALISSILQKLNESQTHIVKDINHTPDTSSFTINGCRLFHLSDTPSTGTHCSASFSPSFLRGRSRLASRCRNAIGIHPSDQGPL